MYLERGQGVANLDGFKCGLKKVVGDLEVLVFRFMKNFERISKPSLLEIAMMVCRRCGAESTNDGLAEADQCRLVC